jgi:hypothetical protein
MINFIKLFFKALTKPQSETPHIFNFERRWQRRVMLFIIIPKEIWAFTRQTLGFAPLWWRWDGTVDPDTGQPVFKSP